MKFCPRQSSTAYLTAVLMLVAGTAAIAAQDEAQTKEKMVTELVTELRGGSFLGVGVAEITAERAKELKLKEVHGVEVTSVEDDSPAAKAGLKKGDVVTEYNGQRVQGVAQFVRLVRETPAGRKASIAVNREGAVQNLEATIAERRGRVLFDRGEGARVIRLPQIDLPEIRIPDVPRIYTSWRSTMLGVEADTLESQLAEYFGVKEGVLIRSVMRGSAAEKAGLRAGDVILRVGDTKVTTPREVTNAIRNRKTKTALPVTIMREKREMTVNVTLEDQRGEREVKRDRPPRRVVVQEKSIEL